jgi:hypothetical protein
MRRYNLNEPEFVDDETDPEGFKTAYDRIAPKVGGDQLVPRDTGAVVYPDSDKISINPKDRRDHIIVQRSSAVDYWDGER